MHRAGLAGSQRPTTPAILPAGLKLSSRGSDPKSAGRYGDLQDVVIGAFQVSGTVGERTTKPAVEPAKTEAPASPDSTVGPVITTRRFHTAKLPSENSEGQLSKLLAECHVPFRYEEAPSP